MSWLPIIGDIIDAFTAQSTTDSTNETNIRLAKEQRDWSEKMWNLQNEYNDPSAVMKRYVNAGINPNFIVSQSGAGLASTPLNTQQARVNPLPPTNHGAALAMAVQLRQQQENLDIKRGLSKSEEFKNRAEGIAEILKQPGIMKDNEIKKWTADFLEQTFGTRKYALSLANDLTQEQINSLKKNQELIDKNIEQLDNAIYNNTRMTDAQINSMNEQLQQGWKSLDIQMQNAVSNRLQADAAYLNASAHMKEVMFKEAYYEEVKKQIREATRGMRIQNNFLRDTYNNRREAIEAQLANLWLQHDWQGMQNYVYKEMMPWRMANERMGVVQNGFNTVVQPLRFQMEFTNSLFQNMTGAQNAIGLPAMY